jgi:uncharacterized protein (DUF302 family)
MNRFEAEVRARGMAVISYIDHAAAAARAGLSLRPTDLLVFGQARDSTPLIEKVQTFGIDLPFKVLVWQDAQGVTWLSYNDASWLTKRHGLRGRLVTLANGATAELKNMAQAATAR